MTLLPLGGAGVYLYGHAADQYASRVGFTVRREEAGSALDLLGGISNLSTASSSDTDILYEFISSQEMLRAVGADLDLQAIFTRPDWDPVFTLMPEASIEDLLAYWQRMVRVFYDPGTGLIEVEVRAFDPQEAQQISQRLFEVSAEMINQLSDVASADSTRYAAQELETAALRLKEARLALTRFRNEQQIVDPQADLQGQMGLLSNLQGQLAAALIELDLLEDTTRAGDPRRDTAQRRIEVIESRIADERAKLGVGGQGAAGTAYADVVGQFESLQVDREFAEQAYLSARAAHDGALAEARRRSRYLAAYVQPTLAESPEYPRRITLLAVLALGLFGIWCLMVLILYSLKDRR